MRTVTQEEFKNITCNRCGACCEQFYFTQQESVAKLIDDIRSGVKQGIHIHKIALDGEAVLTELEFIHDMAIPLDDTKVRYRCRHFTRDETGLGVCTVHDHRPHLCSEFPYDKPVNDIPQCSWNVEIVKEESA